MPPTVTAAEPVTSAAHGALPGETDYHAFNAMLNLYDADGKIRFDKDVQAAHQYFREHVNQNTVFFHRLGREAQLSDPAELLALYGGNMLAVGNLVRSTIAAWMDRPAAAMPARSQSAALAGCSSANSRAIGHGPAH